MTDEVVIDAKTGEVIEADDAWERHRRIVKLRHTAEATFLELGKELYLFDINEQWKQLGHESLNAYLADPDVDIGRGVAYKLIAVFGCYMESLKISPGRLLPAGYTKLDILRPYMTIENVHDWIDRATTLSRSDLRAEIDRVFRRSQEPIKLPEGRYRTIIIDPPWPIEILRREVRPRQLKIAYPLMTTEEIAKLDIPSLCDENGCHIYLWTTHKWLPTALTILTGWGAKYQCLMTWVKPTGMTPFSWMYNTEHVLFGRVAGLRLARLGLKLSFEAPVTRHSEKPDIFYERVRQASPAPRLEMFARQTREGFLVWGNEVVCTAGSRIRGGQIDTCPK